MEIYYRYSENTVRLWAITWAGDMFEVISIEEFKALRENKTLRNLGLQFFEAED